MNDPIPQISSETFRALGDELKQDVPSDEVSGDFEGDWSVGGVGDSRTLADLILSRLAAPASEVFGPALKRLTQWLLFGGDGEQLITDRGIVNRVNALAYFLGVHGQGLTIVDYCEQQHLDRAGFYRHVDRLEEMFGCKLKEPRRAKSAA